MNVPPALTLLIEAATPGRYTVEANGEGRPVLWRWPSPDSTKPVMVTGPTSTLTLADLELVAHLLNLALPVKETTT